MFNREFPEHNERDFSAESQGILDEIIGDMGIILNLKSTMLQEAWMYDRESLTEEELEGKLEEKKARDVKFGIVSHLLDELSNLQSDSIVNFLKDLKDQTTKGGHWESFYKKALDLRKRVQEVKEDFLLSYPSAGRDVN